jgi:hypothetical protein
LTPLEVFLVAALTGVGGYSAWVTKQYIAHLLSDLDYSRKGHERGTVTAERATKVAEKVVSEDSA